MQIVDDQKFMRPPLPSISQKIVHLSNISNDSPGKIQNVSTSPGPINLSRKKTYHTDVKSGKAFELIFQH